MREVFKAGPFCPAFYYGRKYETKIIETEFYNELFIDRFLDPVSAHNISVCFKSVRTDRNG